jgi:hypothetical protein
LNDGQTFYIFYKRHKRQQKLKQGEIWFDVSQRIVGGVPNEKKKVRGILTVALKSERRKANEDNCFPSQYWTLESIVIDVLHAEKTGMVAGSYRAAAKSSVGGVGAFVFFETPSIAVD